MFCPDFFQHCFQSRSGKPLLLYSFCDVRINVCVSVTFLYFISNPWITLSSDKSSRSTGVSLLFSLFLQAFFARGVGLRDSQWGKATKLGRFQDVFAFSLAITSHSARNGTHRSWTDLRPPPEAIQECIDPRSMSKKCEHSHSARSEIDLAPKYEEGLSL